MRFLSNFSEAKKWLVVMFTFFMSVLCERKINIVSVTSNCVSLRCFKTTLAIAAPKFYDLILKSARQIFLSRSLIKEGN